MTTVLIHEVFTDGGDNHYENALYFIDKETEEGEGGHLPKSPCLKVALQALGFTRSGSTVRDLPSR